MNKENKSQIYTGGAVDINKPLPDTNQALTILNDPAHYQEDWKRLVKKGNVVHFKFNQFIADKVRPAGRRFHLTLLATLIGGSILLVGAKPISVWFQKQQYSLMQMMVSESVSVKNEASFISSLPNLEGKTLPKIKDVSELISVMKNGLAKGSELPPIITKGKLYLEDGTPSYLNFQDDISKGVIVTTGVTNNYGDKVWATFVIRWNDNNSYKSFIYSPSTNYILDKNGQIDLDLTQNLIDLKQEKADILKANRKGVKKEDRKAVYSRIKVIDKEIKDIAELSVKQGDIRSLLATKNEVRHFNSFNADNSPITVKTLIENR